jgi:very-short-patch-repair endonuclease
LKNNLLTLAKDLRKNSTDAERPLWKHLRGKQFDRMKFRRQQPIGRYIGDLVCLERKIVVEVDGGHHADAKDQDAIRDPWLHGQGFTVFRFWNYDVLQKIEGVLIKILDHPPQTPPLKGGATCHS